jgi:hypothetical protein
MRNHGLGDRLGVGTDIMKFFMGLPPRGNTGIKSPEKKACVPSRAASNYEALTLASDKYQ